MRQIDGIALRFCGLPFSQKRNGHEICNNPIGIGVRVAGTFAFAQAGGANGTAAGATTLSGTGTWSMGGDTPGAGGSAPTADGSMSSGTTGSAACNQPCGNPNGCPGGSTSLSGTGSSQFGGSTPGNAGKTRIKLRKNRVLLRD